MTIIKLKLLTNVEEREQTIILHCLIQSGTALKTPYITFKEY